ncbi:MAG: hypothetical protein IPN86_01595 [Saprospiraceae bacterium]|nr:hypothetical protein [Saprospiraceae bacterium]
MKPTIILLITLLTTTIGLSQSLNLDFDPQLAEKLGADDYGMKNYILVILKTGKAKMENKDTLNTLFKGHISNIQRLVNEGMLFVAGPFGQNELSYRGLFILNVKTKEEAQALCETDPAIKAGIFDIDLIPWYGSAALGEYIEISKKIGKFKM